MIGINKFFWGILLSCFMVGAMEQPTPVARQSTTGCDVLQERSSLAPVVHVNQLEGVAQTDLPGLFQYETQEPLDPARTFQYLTGLQITANVLLHQNKIVDLLKQLRKYGQVARSYAIPVTFEAISAEMQSEVSAFQQNRSDRSEVDYAKTPLGAVARHNFIVLQRKITQGHNVESIIKKFKKHLEVFAQSHDEDASYIGKLALTDFHLAAMQDKLSRFVADSLVPLLHFAGTLEGKTLPPLAYVNDYFTCIAQKRLLPALVPLYRRYSLDAPLETITPHWSSLLVFVNQLTNSFEIATSDGYSPFQVPEIDTLHTSIKGTTASFAPHLLGYEQRYKTLLREQFRIFAQLPSHIKGDALKAYRTTLFESPEIILPASLMSNPPPSQVVLSNAQQSFALPAPQPTPALQGKKQNKRKKHRPHRKESYEVQESSPNLSQRREQSSSLRKERELPAYAPRILRWFDDAFIQQTKPDQRSVLYHTFNPLADAFIKEFGRAQNRPNNTQRNTLDTVYYAPGAIEYPTGRFEEVLFANAYNSRGILYHRGFEYHGTQLYQEIAQQSFTFNFSQAQDERLKEKKVRSSHPLCPSQTYEETEYYVRLDDPRNNVKIMLFKPLQEK